MGGGGVHVITSLKALRRMHIRVKLSYVATGGVETIHLIWLPKNVKTLYRGPWQFRFQKLGQLFKPKNGG